MATTYTYPFDPTGSATTNAVANERHVLSPPAWSEFYFIVPQFAPYFRDSLRVIHRPSGKLLVEGIDYHCTHYFHAASHGVARRVYGSITMLDKTLVGVLEISYQTIGGDWVLDASADLTRLTNVQTNPRITTWEEVVDVPYQFPPIDHQWDLEDLKGVEAILPILEEMTEAIRQSAGSDFALHIADKANPHSVTKDQVGLDQVQNLPIANIAEAQAGSLNTRYMTPVRTKNFVDSYVIPLLDTHKNDLNNPHGTTKAQVGLGSVLNYGIATQAEAEAGTVANKYMTPLQTKQAIQMLANSSVAAHVADVNNPHATTKAQVGLGSVENFPVASIAEAESASRNDRYMTPLMTAKAINLLVKDSMDLHINATNNPHLVTKTQVGLSNVLNYALATQAEAEAGLIATAYMTPLTTRKAIEAIATAGLASHVNNDQNPHATTKAQVGLGSVENYPIANVTEATLGTSNIRYMTPLLVAAAIEDRVGGAGGLESHIADIANPHQVTAAQVGAYSISQADVKFGEKLNSLAQAADSAALEGHTYEDILATARSQGTLNSDMLGNQTRAQILATAKATTVDNAVRLGGQTAAEIGADLVATLPYTKQLRVPDFEYTIDGSYKWIPLYMASPAMGVDLEDFCVQFTGMRESNGLAVTGLIDFSPTNLVGSVTILSANETALEVLYTNVGGVVRFWLKTNVEFAATTLTVTSGKGWITTEEGAVLSATAPVGSVAIPVVGQATTAEHQALMVSLTGSFDAFNAALVALG